LTLNDEEARQLTGEHNLVKAARGIQQMGPRNLVIKRGEYGALLFDADGDIFAAPALPLEDVVDPTGAGDCFAGGFMGYLARPGIEASGASLRTAMIFGSVMASFCVEGFSYDRLRGLDTATIQRRFEAFSTLTNFDRATLLG
jgi:sugar/nucleoside kinase (ribokinase family)